MPVDVTVEQHTTTETPWYIKVALPVFIAVALGMGISAYSRAVAVESRLTRSESSQEGLKEAAIALRVVQTDLGFRIDAGQTNINNRFDSVMGRLSDLNGQLARIEGRLDAASDRDYTRSEKRRATP